MPHPHLTVETSPDGYRVCDEPELAAGQMAAGLAGRGTGVKMVMAAGGLLDRLRSERSANRSAWARAISLASGS